jgi:hypothetical protein
VLQPAEGLVALPLGFAAGMAVKVALLAVVLRYRITRLEAVDGGPDGAGAQAA